MNRAEREDSGLASRPNGVRSVMRVRPKGGRAVIILDFTAINLSCTSLYSAVAFWDFTAVNLSLDHAALYCLYLRLDRRERSCVYTLDNDGTNRFVSSRAFQRLSYRNFVKFWYYCWNCRCGLDLQAVGDILDPFLAEFIGKSCSNEAK